MGENTELDIRRLLGQIRRRLWLVIGTIVAIMLVAALVVFSLTPLYTATALVFVDTSNKNLLDPQAQLNFTGTENARVDSEVAIMGSEAVLLRVIRENGLERDDEFNGRNGLRQRLMTWLRLDDGRTAAGGAELQHVLGELRDRVSIARHGATFVIAVKVTSRDRTKAADLANAIAETYIDNQIETKVGSTLAARDILQRRIDQAAIAVTEAETALEDFITSNLASIVSSSGSQAAEELRRQLVSARERRAEGLSAIALANREIGQENWRAVSDALRSQVLGALAEERETAAAMLSESDPERQAGIRAELARIDRELNRTAQQALVDLRQQVSSAESEAADLRQQIRTTVLESDLPPDVLTSLYQLQQSAEIRRSQFQVLLSRLRDVEAQADLQIADSRIVSAASPPSQPSFPRTVLILSGAFCIAGIVGGGLAVLRENFVGGIVSEAQAEEVLGVSYVTAVPFEKAPPESDLAESPTAAGLMVQAPLSIYAEAIRRLRLTLDRISFQKKHGNIVGMPNRRIIMLTSATLDEGKTVTAISLARAYAQLGLRTLLIDCDLRRPSVASYLGIKADHGLNDYLSDPKGFSGKISEFVCKDPTTDLRIIPSHRKPEVPPSGLINSGRFATLIETAGRTFDVVILDTPPVGPVVDGLHIASLSDVVVMVVRWASTSQDQIRSAMRNLKLAASPDMEFCVVLNQVARSEYPSNYSYYYNESEPA